MSETQYDIYENLINEFLEQRSAIKLMIADLEKFKSRIDTILPESLDKRYIKFFEEKIKINEVFLITILLTFISIIMKTYRYDYFIYEIVISILVMVLCYKKRFFKLFERRRCKFTWVIV